MSTTVRLRRKLESETLHRPELRDLVGRDVEIVVTALAPPAAGDARYPLRGSVLRVDEPLAPLPEGDWESLG